MVQEQWAGWAWWASAAAARKKYQECHCSFDLNGKVVEICAFKVTGSRRDMSQVGV